MPALLDGHSDPVANTDFDVNLGGWRDKRRGECLHMLRQLEARLLGPAP
jgi:hypothetical protein